MIINIVIADGSTEFTLFTLSGWQFLTVISGFFPIIMGFLFSSYKYGEKVGEAKGYTLGFDTGYKDGFTNGKRDFFKTTRVVDNVVCKYHPKKDPILNGISIIKRYDGTPVDVECPYIEEDKICQLTSKACYKL